MAIWDARQGGITTPHRTRNAEPGTRNRKDAIEKKTASQSVGGSMQRAAGVDAMQLKLKLLNEETPYARGNWAETVGETGTSVDVHEVSRAL